MPPNWLRDYAALLATRSSFAIDAFIRWSVVSRLADRKRLRDAAVQVLTLPHEPYCTTMRGLLPSSGCL